MICHVLIALIRLYQRTLSTWMPPCCRYTPTCSEYAIEALRMHGLVKGLWLAMLRLLRCNPFFHGGYDPVPQPKDGRVISKRERFEDNHDLERPKSKS